METLIFVDRALSIAIAAKLLGVLSTKGKSTTARIGTNWIVTAGFDDSKSETNQYDIRELLPEDLIYTIYDNIPTKCSTVPEALPKLLTGASGGLLPGNVISIKGKLKFLDFKESLQASPFQQVELQLREIMFHGEKCIVAELFDESYKIPVFFPLESQYQVAYCQDQPVEIIGIVKWTPPYSAGGAKSLNLAIRGAAIFLR